jgi:hypothetical protein
MTTKYSYAPSTDPTYGQDRRFRATNLEYFLLPDIGISLALAGMLAALVWLTPYIQPGVVVESFLAATHSIIVALAGSAIFHIIFAAFFLIVYSSFLKRVTHPEYYALTISIGFLTIVAIGSIPITQYIEWEDLIPGSNFLKQCIALAFANSLLYLTLLSLLHEIKTESRMTYVRSAPFKAATEANYLRERLVWASLSRQQSLFYYMLSFTLFTDKMFATDLEAMRGQHGAIGQLFDELLNRGWTDLFGIQITVLIICALFVRGILGFPVKVWERSHHVERD